MLAVEVSCRFSPRWPVARTLVLAIADEGKSKSNIASPTIHQSNPNTALMFANSNATSVDCPPTTGNGGPDILILILILDHYIYDSAANAECFRPRSGTKMQTECDGRVRLVSRRRICAAVALSSSHAVSSSLTVSRLFLVVSRLTFSGLPVHAIIVRSCWALTSCHAQAQAQLHKA